MTRSPALKSKSYCRVLEAALAAVADAVIATAADDVVIYMNAAAESLTGWRSDEAQGKLLTQVFFLVDEDDKVIEDPLVGLKVAGAADIPLRLAAVVNRRGIQVGMEFKPMAVRGARGRFDGAVIVFRARRQMAEIALQASNQSLLANADALFEEKERAQVTLDSIGDAVISTNFNGKVSYLNVVAEKITGWVEADAAGKAVDDIFRLIGTEGHGSIPCPTAQAIISNRRVSLEAVSLRRHDGREVPVEVSAAPIHDRLGGVVGAVMVAHDVTAARELSMKLARLALHDSLTDLPNRALFADRLAKAVAHAQAQGGFAALLYVDLDGFKRTNDSLGHAIGDQLLQTVARRLLGCVRSSDTVCRQGGDEFVVLLADLKRVLDAGACAEKILVALAAPYMIAEHELRLTASIGVAIYPNDAREPDALLRCADHAMYQAKQTGRNRYEFSSPEVLLAP